MILKENQKIRVVVSIATTVVEGNGYERTTLASLYEQSFDDLDLPSLILAANRQTNQEKPSNEPS